MWVAARYWAKVNKDGPIPAHVPGIGPCWQWTAGCFECGYGQFHRGFGTTYAHRISWEIHYGSIPEGLWVLHRCDNRKCVRPEHLFLGTHVDNMRDMVEKARSTVGDRNGSRLHPERLRRGDSHPSRTKPERRPRGDGHWARLRPESLCRGESHGQAKLNEVDVIEIRRLVKEGNNGRNIAARFGVSQVLVSLIARRKAWKHVPESTEVV